MASSIPHGARSTANQVLAGVDLTRKWMLVTGCNEEIGFETMNALAANGAHVFGLANSLASAKYACDQIGPRATPVACDLADLDSVAAAAEKIRGLEVSLDAIIANSEVASLLYALLLIQPATGLAQSLLRGRPVGLFAWSIPPLLTKDLALAAIFHEAHEIGAWCVIALAGLHATAALIHHFILRDDVLEAMAPVFRRRGAP